MQWKGVEYEKAYPVKGCYGDYKDMMIKLVGPDGNDLYGTFSLLPRYDTLRAGIVGGENLFETTGYLEFEEVSG